MTRHYFFIELHAHAVQALEFERCIGVSRAFQYGRNGVRIVGGELAVKNARLRQHFCRTREVGNIGIGFACEHRIIAKALHLRALDFGIPVGALHQSGHDAATVGCGERSQPVNDVDGALLIRLHGETQTFIADKPRIAVDRCEQRQRQLQPLGFFRVERQANAALARQPAKRHQLWQQFMHHPIQLRQFIARVQRGKLDRNAGRVEHMLPRLHG